MKSVELASIAMKRIVQSGNQIKRRIIWKADSSRRIMVIGFDKVISNPLAATLGIFTLTALTVITLTVRLDLYNSEFLANILIEAYGLLLDILLVGTLILWFIRKGERRIETRRYLEEIDDLRGWQSEEAVRKIRGNILRLLNNGERQIDLSYSYLKGAK